MSKPMSKREQRGSTAQIGRPPVLPRAYVPRHRLWARLDHATEAAVTVVVGPGGSGKTLGVAGWLRESGRAADSTWVTADPTWDGERLVAQLARRTDDDRPALVVVDDAHLLPLDTVRAVDELLDAAPDSFRVLLLSRWDLPLSRLASELLGHLTLLRGDLLRLDDDESAALVAAHARTDCPEVARAIAARTQGWCAAVVLTSRAVGAAPDPLVVARQYAEGGPVSVDRVVSEVFATLRPRERHLLLCVASEPVVTPALAEHLSHDADAGAVLADLGATGLLVTRVDALDPADLHAPEVRYSIHPLLAEVVRRRILAGGVDVVRAAATIQRAVDLDVGRGATADALHRLEAIGEHAAAAALVADEGPSLLLRGHGGPVHDFARAHPSAIEVNPGSWFAVALERWFVGDVTTAAQWLERILQDPQPDTAAAVLHQACARVMRSRLGLEPIGPAVDHAQRMAVDPQLAADASAVVPILLCELAVTQTWTGDLAAAEDNLGAAIRLSRTHDLPVLAVVALSHLALTQYLRGHERSAVEVAEQVLALAAERGLDAPYSRGRAHLARQLAVLSDLPLTRGVRVLEDDALPGHAADLTTRYWIRARRSRLELARGSVAAAELALDVPLDTPPLPAHLAVRLLVERAFLASLSGDGVLLGQLHEQLDELGATAEASLVAGLRADLLGDRRAAVRHLARAADGPAVEQPAIRALALVSRAQLVDGLGDRHLASALVLEALRETQVRRNAVPFLGWSRHGTSVPELVGRLAATSKDPWLTEIAADLDHLTGIAAHFGPSTPRPGERQAQPEGAIRPTLSPRERDVLHELARGSTYADIAANLFVSENTVKTHVSSLYAKLSVNRRSAALAAARSMQLL
jgi:LuxR family transcriptional regulator, maltose regulon positive regulatory protein